MTSPAANYVITRLRRTDNSGFKAPRDVREIGIRHGLRPLDLDANGGTLRKVFRAMLETPRLWWLLRRLTVAQTVVSQYPLGLVPDTVLAWRRWPCFRVALVHDIETLRHGRDIGRDVRQLSNYDVLIAHNERMREWLQANLPNFVGSIVVLQVFDYLTRTVPDLPSASPAPDGGYVVGNLDPAKAGFLYGAEDLGISVRCYGSNVDVPGLRPGITHLGNLDPDAPAVLERNGFGVVWDGPDAHSLASASGGYLRYNSPHKLSCYVVLGFPVVVSAESALAGFVEHRGIGLVVSDLSQVGASIVGTRPEQWSRMLHNVATLRAELLRGDFTSAALNSALSIKMSGSAR